MIMVKYIYNHELRIFLRRETIVSYNVQPLRTNEEIQDFQFWLRRTSNPERDSFLFLFGINNGLRMSDIIGLKVGDIRGKSKPIIVEHKTGKRKPIFIDNLREEHIQRSFDGNIWIKTKRQKTLVNSNVPLLDVPKAILEKYKNRQPNGKLLPVISNRICNLLCTNSF